VAITYYNHVRGNYAQVSALTALGKVAVGLVHDLANMTQYSLEAQKYDHARVARDFHDVARIIDAARKRLGQELDTSWFSAAYEVRHVISFLKFTAQQKHIHIELTAEPNIQLHGSRTQFYQCITNLLINAIEAYDHAGYTSHQVRKVVVRIASSQNGCVVMIKDWASGIPRVKLRYIFRPFYTSKAHSKNLGLGLSMTKDVVTKTFQGKLYVRSVFGVGTTFVMLFPNWRRRGKYDMLIADGKHPRPAHHSRTSNGSADGAASGFERSVTAPATNQGRNTP
jgi:signal transduction histidine kinase